MSTSKLTSISVSPPALVMSPLLTPGALLFGSCRKVMTIFPELGPPTTIAELIPTGLPTESVSV